MLDLFDLVKTAEVALGVALAVAVVTGLPLVVTPELGLTVPAGLLVDGDGVVSGADGVTCGDVAGLTVSLGLGGGGRRGPRHLRAGRSRGRAAQPERARRGGAAEHAAG